MGGLAPGRRPLLVGGELVIPLHLVGAPSSDCERIAVVGVAQQVNTWTSIGYLVAGAAVLIAASRRRLTSVAWLLGALVVAEGVGSMAFHGRPGPASQWLHDVALVGVLGLVAGWHLARLAGPVDDVGRTTRFAWIGGISATVVAGALHLVTDSFVNVVAAALLGVIAVAEVAARRRGAAPVIRTGLVLLAVVAAAAYLLGRTDGPLCEPDSIVQLHGAWHALTALAMFVWADRALAHQGPRVGSGSGRLVFDTVAGTAARVVVRAFHRSVDVDGRSHLPSGRPVLLVANHGNGFVDPVVVAAALGRLPRFIAKAALWKVVPARVALDALAVLPVHRASDGDDRTANDATFAATTDALRRCDTVAIFPEGTTGDRAHLDRVRAGAARIALGARDAGVTHLAVVPVGLAFESRVQTRSRAAVTFGEPLDLDDWCGARDVTIDDDDRAEVRALTEEIRVRLGAVSPVFASVDEREQLRMAAGVVLAARESAGRAPTFGEIDRLARRLASAPPESRAAVVDALADHALRREMVGVSDADLTGGALRRRSPRLALALVAMVLFGPLLALAALVHLPCVLAVHLAVAKVPSTATKGTVRILVGLLTAVTTWWIAAMIVTDGAARVLAVMAGVAVLGAVALATWTWVVDAVTTARRRFRAFDRRALVPALAASQQHLVDAVSRAVAAAVSDTQQVVARSADETALGHTRTNTTG